MTFYIGTKGNNRHHGTENVMIGKSGNDYFHQISDIASTLEGQEGDDLLVGHSADDSLFGGRGADNLLGEAGNDYLNGGKGGDRLYGGTGNDLLIGGSGKDKFEFFLVGKNKAPVDPGFDCVLDFEPGRDTIVIVGATDADYSKKTGIVTATTKAGEVEIAKMQKHLKITDFDFDLVP